MIDARLISRAMKTAAARSSARRAPSDAVRGDGDDHPAHGPQLAHDLAALHARINRRQLLRAAFGGGVLAAVGCAVVSSSASSALQNVDGSCNAIPGETAGPYPADGTNGENALVLDGIVRSDIRSSFGGMSGVAEGVLLTVTLTLLDEACDPLTDHAIYLWHCDRDGHYSLYTAANQNYLRGVQVTDGAGKVTFTTIFPGAYSGRWPHIHFEVYRTMDDAIGGGTPVSTSQLALPEAACETVYTSAGGYEASIDNLASTSLDSDNVFSDGTSRQLATVGGDVDSGMTAELTFAV